MSALLLGKTADHLLPAPVDSDGDLLSDMEEQQLGKDGGNPDENGNQVPDGVELAKAFAMEIAELPTKPEMSRVYRLDFLLRGLEWCDLCGQSVNMGHLTVCNPRAQLYSELPYIALHYFEHGSLSFAGDVHGMGRLDVVLLDKCLHSAGPSHLVPTAGDSDGDGLKDVEEAHFRTDAGLADSDNDGVPDGFVVARRLGQEVSALPRTPGATTYAVEHMLRGLVTCPVCGAQENMGYLEIINPRENLKLELPYLSLHYLRHGGFGGLDLRRTEPALLDLALHGDGTAHLVKVAGDSDGDGLRDTEEAVLGYRPDQADSDGDGVADGVALARELHRQINRLPTEATALGAYVVHHAAKCFAPCPACGVEINCGHVEIVGPGTGQRLPISYLNLHYLERGSLAASDQERIDPLALRALLSPAVLLALTPETATLRWIGVAGRNYQVFMAAEVTGPWEPGPLFTGTGVELSFADSDIARCHRKFYKVVAW